MRIGIIGAGGHAKVIVDILLCLAKESKAELEIRLFDDHLPTTLINGFPVIGKVKECEKFNADGFVIAIGANETRRKIAEKFTLPYITLIHPSTVIAGDVRIEEGTVIMPGVIINSGSTIGKHCIINTSATLDHDNRIHDFVHISPGAHLGGTVEIGSNSWVGIGSSIINNVTIGPGCVIGAGSVVVRDFKLPGIYYGNPARRRVTNIENKGAC